MENNPGRHGASSGWPVSLGSLGPGVLEEVVDDEIPGGTSTMGLSWQPACLPAGSPQRWGLSVDVQGSSGRGFVPAPDPAACVCFSFPLWLTGAGPL